MFWYLEFYWFEGFGFLGENVFIKGYNDFMKLEDDIFMGLLWDFDVIGFIVKKGISLLVGVIDFDY